jgi:hypothetical protein
VGALLSIKRAPGGGAVVGLLLYPFDTLSGSFHVCGGRIGVRNGHFRCSSLRVTASFCAHKSNSRNYVTFPVQYINNSGPNPEG